MRRYKIPAFSHETKVFQSLNNLVINKIGINAFFNWFISVHPESKQLMKSDPGMQFRSGQQFFSTNTTAIALIRIVYFENSFY
jgi:hypothetical protein